jgi:Glyoxalase-like domain
MGRFLLFLLIVMYVVPARADFSIQGLDHVPVVVRDLDQAKVDFEALGFVLKPGQPHANGLRNLHAKFPDGTEIELISATSASDRLSSDYLEWQRVSDGPVSFGLYVPDQNAAFRPGAFEGVFYDHRQKSPTDRPEHFAHPNGATSLTGVWLAGRRDEMAMRMALGSRAERAVCAPFLQGPTPAPVAQLPEGEIVFLPEAFQRLRERSIVALTVAVKSLDTVKRLVNGRTESCAPNSVWMETHGFWLELRAP